jgi:hypothetical protein
VTLTAATVLTAAAMTAAPATAAAVGCTATLSGKTATAKCSSGTGELRAAIICGRYRPVEFEWTQYGPWVPVGQTSKVTCAPNAQYADFAFVERR